MRTEWQAQHAPAATIDPWRRAGRFLGPPAIDPRRRVMTGVRASVRAYDRVLVDPRRRPTLPNRDQPEQIARLEERQAFGLKDRVQFHLAHSRALGAGLRKSMPAGFSWHRSRQFRGGHLSRRLTGSARTTTPKTGTVKLA